MMQQWANYLDDLKAGAKVAPFKQAWHTQKYTKANATLSTQTEAQAPKRELVARGLDEMIGLVKPSFEAAQAMYKKRLIFLTAKMGRPKTNCKPFIIFKKAQMLDIQKQLYGPSHKIWQSSPQYFCNTPLQSWLDWPNRLLNVCVRGFNNIQYTQKYAAERLVWLKNARHARLVSSVLQKSFLPPHYPNNCHSDSCSVLNGV